LNCPVCEADLDLRSLLTIPLATPRGNQQWVRCTHCHSFFALSPYDSELETAHTRTRPWGIEKSGIALNNEKSPMFKAVLRALRPYVEKGTSLLDIGCSYGGFLQLAQEEGYNVRGIDIVPEAVEYVRSQGIPCERAKSAGDLDIPINSMGVITALDINYYWPDQKRELRAIRSILSHDGVLAVRTVDTSWAVQIGLLLKKLLPAAGRRLCERAVYDHRVSIPLRSLLRIVEEEGFEIIYLSQRDAMPFRRNSLKVKAIYAIAYVALRLGGWHLAPGCVFLARKRTP